MGTILDQIIAHKKVEVEQASAALPVTELEKWPGFERPTISLTSRLMDPRASGIIAEFKRRSPSKGLINGDATVSEVADGYAKAGVSGVSILTDTEFFGGSKNDLMKAREVVGIPLLRKDFIIDEYQVVQARAIGADLILLIAANLTPQRLRELAAFAKTLDLEVLMEVHNQEELDQYLNPHLDIVGVNNRNLKTFETSVEVSCQLAGSIPIEFVKITESGIHEATTLVALKEAGYQGFLIGENFMKTDNPVLACQQFIEAVKKSEGGTR